METIQNSQRTPTVFTAWVDYTQPDFEELKRRFPAYVNPDYKGGRFDPIERCKAVSKKSREVIFECVYINTYSSTLDVLVVMSRRGLRPALPEELLGVAAKYLDWQWRGAMIVLGSEMRVNGDRKVAFLWNPGNGQSLGLDLFSIDCNWTDYDPFLAVRE